MRFPLALAALALCASMAQAQSQSTDTDALFPTLDAVCKFWGDWGYQIMEGRQLGVPMSDMMQLVNSREDGPGTTFPTSVHRAAIIEAYGRPRRLTQPMQDRAADDFRNELEHGCYVLNSP